MIELFPDVSPTFKKYARFIIEQALYQKDILTSIQMIKEFSDTCINESEKDFMDFYLNLILMETVDENNSNQR